MKKMLCPNIWMNNGAGGQIQLGDFLRWNDICVHKWSSELEGIELLDKEIDEIDELIERLTITREFREYMKKEENIFCVLFMRHTSMKMDVYVPRRHSVASPLGELPICNGRDVNFVSLGDECDSARCGKNSKTEKTAANGKITDRVAAESAIVDCFREVKEKLDNTPVSKLLVVVPADFTAEDLEVLRDAAKKSGVGDIRFIYRPLSEALSLGCDIYKPHAKMIVHFGDAATEISVIAMGGIVASKTVPVSVNTFAEDMCDYISRNYNVQIDIKTAKDMLTNYWSFPTGKSRSRKKEYSVAGSAESIEMSYVDVSKALGNSLDKIEKAVTVVLDALPPELLGDLAIGKVVSWLRRKEEKASLLKETADSWVFFDLDEDISYKKDEQITVTGNWPFAPALKERVGETLAQYFQKSYPKKDVIKELKRNLSKIVVNESEDWGSPSKALEMRLMLFDRFDDILIK